MEQVEKCMNYYPPQSYKHEDYRDQYKKLKKEAEAKTDIIQCVPNKDQIIDALSAEEQFQLAQEYNLINRVLEIIQPGPNNTSFRDSYYLCLKKAAAKGYQPAEEELVQLYSKGYMQKNTQQGVTDITPVLFRKSLSLYHQKKPLPINKLLRRLRMQSLPTS